MMKRLLMLAISLVVRGIDVASDLVRHSLKQPLPARGVVLYYHAVKVRQRQRFAEQMDALCRYASPFSAASPETMRGARYQAAVTFDDGFTSVLTNAVPELTKRAIPFTIFIPTGSLGQKPAWVRHPSHAAWEERVLSERELRDLVANPLATIGSHSITHPNFLEIDAATADDEFSRSKAHLETVLRTQVDLLSYPYGAHNAALDRRARHAGYRRVFSIDPSMVTPDAPHYAIGRVIADPDEWPIEFRLKLHGAYRWRSYLRRLA